MINLLKFIYSQLSQVTQVYQEQAQEDAKMPYAVFKCDTLDNIDHKDLHVLEVNVWDNNTDATDLENITDSIIKKLDRMKYIDLDFSATINKMTRLSLPDPGTSIRRREVRFEIKTREVK